MTEKCRGDLWSPADKRKYHPLLDRINELLAAEPLVLVAIDGDAAAGKSTLADALGALYDCNVLRMDHFFLRPEQRTEARRKEPGGNVDYERFLTEAQTPIRAGETATYRPFDCKTFTMGEEMTHAPKQLNIIEGAYSLHPTLAAPYHIKVCLTIDPEEQLRRIRARNGEEMAERFRDEWIPLEKRYFDEFDIASQCDFIFHT